MKKSSKIYVAGHSGLAGSAILRNLKGNGYRNLLIRTYRQLDLTNQTRVANFFRKERPHYVFLAAAKVGGIAVNNSHRADFILQNLSIQNHVISAAHQFGVKKLLFLGSSCIYPKKSPQPIRESHLLGGELEYTNEPYAVAKIAGLKLCESFNLQYGTNFLALMPTNLYGPGDNYDLQTSHVLPALVLKCVLAKLLREKSFEQIQKIMGIKNRRSIISRLNKQGISAEKVTVWGTGRPRREFLHSDDLARACVHVMQQVDFRHLINPNGSTKNTHINVGYGEDLSIKQLAQMIKKAVGFKGNFEFDASYPDGTYRKLLDSHKIRKLGWEPSISLEEGIRGVIAQEFPFVLK